MDEELQKRLNYIDSNSIILCRSGSKSYGTSILGSDEDFKGICILPDLSKFIGLSNFDQQDSGWLDAQGNKQDKVITHLQKWIKLAVGANPNCLETLFCDDSDVLKITEEGKKLKENRNLFLSKKCLHSYRGFSHSQIARLKAHKRWVDGPVEKPKQSDFEHEKNFVIGPHGTNLPQGAKVKSIRPMTPEDLKYVDKEKEYDFTEGKWYVIECTVFDAGGFQAQKLEHQNYNTWVKNRNPARAALEKELSYDSKALYHAVRLARTGFELIITGTLLVRRPDAGELIEIRKGKWSYDYAIKYLQELEEKTEEAQKLSPLPWGVDMNKIETLQMDLILGYLKKHKKL